MILLRYDEEPRISPTVGISAVPSCSGTGLCRRRVRGYASGPMHYPVMTASASLAAFTATFRQRDGRPRMPERQPPPNPPYARSTTRLRSMRPQKGSGNSPSDTQPALTLALWGSESLEASIR
jgi:hypothetical protein